MELDHSTSPRVAAQPQFSQLLLPACLYTLGTEKGTTVPKKLFGTALTTVPKSFLGTLFQTAYSEQPTVYKYAFWLE